MAAAAIAAEPAIAAAGGAGITALGKAWDKRHEIAAGTRGAIQLAKVGSSAGRKLANMLFTSSGRKKTAKTILDKIKNPVRSAKEFSDYIASGKALKTVKTVAGHANAALDLAEHISGKDLGDIRGAVKGATDQATHYHDIISQYNDEGRDMFKAPPAQAIQQAGAPAIPNKYIVNRPASAMT